MRSPPLVLDSIEDTGRSLRRIEAKPSDLKTESWLQALLYDHPELLPVDELDDSYAPLIPIGREVHTDRGFIDNLYVSPEGGITVVETKLWKNPEKHRTVVAQIIDYAKELVTWDYDQLCAGILDSSRRREETGNLSLEEKVVPSLSAANLALHEFQENVATCLREGNFLLLIVGDRISPNIALLTKAIESAPGLGFTIALMEMQLYELSVDNEWPLVVVPEVVGRTVERTRGIVHVRYSQEKPEISVDVDDEERDGSGPARLLDLDLFIQEVPKDLRQAYQEGVEAWEEIGGTIQFTNKMMFFAIPINGETRRLVRCRTYQISVVRRKNIEQWGLDRSIYEHYLEALEDSPVAYAHAREDKTWIRYEKLSAEDLRILFQAARTFVERL